MRAFTPWPGAYTQFRDSTCHLLGQPVSKEHRIVGAQHAAPFAAGEIRFERSEFLVSCGEETLLRVSRVKVEGRKEISALELANGARLQSGEHFR